MSFEINLVMAHIPSERMQEVLVQHGIQLNAYAHAFMAHPDFYNDIEPLSIQLQILSVEELGFADGAAFPEILTEAQKRSLYPCPPVTGIYLRLQMAVQQVSRNSVLTGTHDAPEGAITVVSHPLEEDVDFPRGLYLRNVDGALWLRGYICDDTYRWKPTDLLAFEMR